MLFASGMLCHRCQEELPKGNQINIHCPQDLGVAQAIKKGGETNESGVFTFQAFT